MDSTLLYKYFPDLTDAQRRQFEMMGELYADWNARINVVSRKDIDNLYNHHVLHSLVIAKFLGPLTPGTSFLDIGTGGGFPGVPLAVYYPECQFHLIDRIGKKIKVAHEVSGALGLENVTFQHGDIGECRDKYDYVVSRAVMALNALMPLVRKNIKRGQLPGNRYPNGLVCLKGGDIELEKVGLKENIIEYPVCEFIPEPFFDEKLVVYAH